jgi:hypothetical protein
MNLIHSIFIYLAIPTLVTLLMLMVYLKMIDVEALQMRDITQQVVYVIIGMEVLLFPFKDLVNNIDF